jgi:hypothetical protein
MSTCIIPTIVNSSSGGLTTKKRWQMPFFSIIIIIIIKKKRFVGGCAIQFFSDLSGLSFEMLDWALVRRTHSNKKRWWQPPSPSSLSSRRDLFQGFPLN